MLQTSTDFLVTSRKINRNKTVFFSRVEKWIGGYETLKILKVVRFLNNERIFWKYPWKCLENWTCSSW